MGTQPALAERPEVESVTQREGFPDTAHAPAVILPSLAVRAYLGTFGICAIVACADGHIGVTKDMGRAAKGRIIACWWTTAAGTVAIMRQCGRDNNDIVSVAAGPRIPLTLYARPSHAPRQRSHASMRRSPRPKRTVHRWSSRRAA
jgi:hypothetical protein